MNSFTEILMLCDAMTLYFVFFKRLTLHGTNNDFLVSISPNSDYKKSYPLQLFVIL